MSASEEEAPESLRQQLERGALDHIWSGTRWLSVDQVIESAPAAMPITEAEIIQWELDRRLFSLLRSGQSIYPHYVFTEDFRPRPAIAAVLATLRSSDPLSVAVFFESTSSFLSG